MTRALALLLYAGSAVFAAALVSAQTPPRDPGAQGPFGGARGGFARGVEPTVGTAAIRGRIVAANTGTPIRRAQVRAVAPESRASRIASTDADGRFELRDLPAGRWQLTASKAGFVTLRFGQSRPFEAGRPVELKSGEVLERVEMALPRASAITGRVFDEFGDPVAGARVQVLRYQLVQGRRRLAPTGIADQSDDTGAFRLFGLMPGEYFVSASLRALQVDDPTSEAAGYAPTYYPGTGSVAEAQAIPLSLGQELNSVNFALLPVRTVRISGTVVDSTGAPLANGLAMLVAADGNGLNAGRGNIRGNGAFMLPDVAPGAYSLMVSTGPGPGRRGGQAPEVAQLPLTVGNEDVTGIYISTTAGASVTGSVAAAAGSAGSLPDDNLQITAPAAYFDPGIGVRSARVDANGTFTLSGLFGERFIRVTGVPASWMVQSVVLNGVDVADTAISFRPNEQLTGLRVLLTDRVTELTGKVATASGTPSRDYTVVVFPEDEAKWTPASRYLRSGRPDQDGLFKIRTLPPDARYLAVAVDYLEEGEGMDPRFLEQIRTSATRFALGEGETKALNLELVQR